MKIQTDTGNHIHLNGERIAVRVYGTQAGWYYFINDHLGTPHKLVNESGEVVWAAAYLPFGEARIVTKTVANNFRFPGQYYDVETGLYYNWNRYYDPKTGRYLTPDPIGQTGGINLYPYALNAPVNFVDPSGLLFGFNAGEYYGADAAQYYATIIIDPDASALSKAGAWAGGLLASLWTPNTSDYTFGVLTIGYAAGNVQAVLPNISEWASSPFWYEIGQKTVPTSIYNALKYLPAAERGKAIVAELRWIRTLLPSLGPWGITLAEGPTPGGVLGVFGLGTASIISGASNDYKECR